MCERNDGSYDRGGILIGVQISNETHVDFQLLDRKALQVADARIAGTEVVDRHHHAQTAQLLQDRIDWPAWFINAASAISSSR